MKENKIISLDDRMHVLMRPSMYIGGVEKETNTRYILNNKISKENVTITPGLLKIFREILDNSIDEFIRTNGKFSNTIRITLTKDYFSIKDNGRGIPQDEVLDTKGNKILTPLLAFTSLRTGSNFSSNSTTIGANGAGGALTNFYSKKFHVITSDGKNKCIIETENNSESVKINQRKSKEKGTEVCSYPDFKRFNETHFTEDYFKVIETELYILAVSYPLIKFYFNNKEIKITHKNFFNLFSELETTIISNENYSLAFIPQDNDEFEHFTIMNGLFLKNGGSCVDYIISSVSNTIKEKLSKKYPTIKPADIKNKIFLISILNNFVDAKYDSQTKEKLTNSQKEVSNYFNIDLNEIGEKVFKNKEILSRITDFFKIKEAFKLKQDLQKLEKTQKKIKSNKYIPAIGDTEYLFLCEGYSAVSALQSVLGRKNKAYFELKGKIVNVSDNKKAISENKELKELYSIIKALKSSDMYKITLDEQVYYVKENDIIKHNNKTIYVKDLI